MSASDHRMSQRWLDHLLQGWPTAHAFVLAQLHRVQHISRANTFKIVSFVVLLTGMSCASWWLGSEVEQRVMQHAVSLSTLYIDSFVAPQLRDLDGKQVLPPDKIAALDTILSDSALGREIVALIIWSKDGQVLYSSNHAQIGAYYEFDQTLRDTFAGQVVSEITQANTEAHIPEQHQSAVLLAMYNPIYYRDTQEIRVTAEFYQAADPLLHDIYSAQQRTWLVIGGITLVMYLLLIGFVQNASDTIDHQQARLSTQVARLTDLLQQNTELHDRMRHASHRAATLNERVLRQVSAELHDGPAQYLGLALLHVDRVVEYHEQHPDTPVAKHTTIVESSLAEAMREIRNISSGLGLPQLGELSLKEVIELVIHSHEGYTGTTVAFAIQDTSTPLSLALKSTLYRVIQESLTNASRHGQGLGQQVRVSSDAHMLYVEVIDQGPGFEPASLTEAHEHLGLVGMRDRVESLGGQFRVESVIGMGTHVHITLPYTDFTTTDR